METTTRKAARKILAASFPSYRGRTIRLHVTDCAYMGGMHWDGGNRSQYVALRFDGASHAVETSVSPWDRSEYGVVSIPAGCALVRHTVSGGVDCGIDIYINPETQGAIGVTARGMIA